MATATQAEKLHRLAEERFLVNDVAGALRAAREAHKLCPSLDYVASALAAYEVHAAASTGASARKCWYAAVLGVSPMRVTHDGIKQGYRRLCLVLHPDKNRSVAADGAFKLVREAWEVLSARHPPAPAPTAPPTPMPAPAAPPTPMPASAAPPMPTNDIRVRPTPAASAGAQTVFYNFTPRGGVKAPCAFRPIYCSHGHWTLLAADKDQFGVNCTVCGDLLGNPPTYGEATCWGTPHASSSSKFPCPMRCPSCRAPEYASLMVSVGKWWLECPACHQRAPVHVSSPSHAYRLHDMIEAAAPSSSPSSMSAQVCYGKRMVPIKFCSPHHMDSL